MITFNARLDAALSLCERRGEPFVQHMFHGTSSRKALYDILNHGLRPGDGLGASYLGSLETALIYSSSPLRSDPHHQRGTASVVEVIVNLNDNMVGTDEDALPTTEAPTDATYADGKDDWDDYFDAQMPYVKPVDRPEVAQAIIVGNGDVLRRIAHRLRPDYTLYNGKHRHTGATQINVTSRRPIGLRGRTRIVGAYIFKDVDEYGYDMICSKVVYTNGGSIIKGQAAKAAREHVY